MIICVAGSGSKAGKTTFCKAFLKHVGKESWQYLSTSDSLIVALAKKMKCSVQTIRDNKEMFRKELVHMSDHDPMYPLEMTIERLDDSKDHLIFESIRRPCEYTYFQELGATFIYVHAKEATRQLRGAGSEDVDASIDDLFFPQGELAKNCYSVWNDGTFSQLNHRVEHLIRALL